MSMRRLPQGYLITPAAPEDVADLVFADLAASKLFAGTGYLPEAALAYHVPVAALEGAMLPAISSRCATGARRSASR